MISQASLLTNCFFSNLTNYSGACYAYNIMFIEFIKNLSIRLDNIMIRN